MRLKTLLIPGEIEFLIVEEGSDLDLESCSTYFVFALLEKKKNLVTLRTRERAPISIALTQKVRTPLQPKSRKQQQGSRTGALAPSRVMSPSSCCEMRSTPSAVKKKKKKESIWLAVTTPTQVSDDALRVCPQLSCSRL